MLASLTAFIGTLTGKVLIGGSVAVASIGGAHAAGVVDIPGLPEVDDSSVTQTLDDDSDDRGPDDRGGDDSDDTTPTIVTTSTTVPSSSSTSTTSPAPTITLAPSTSTTTPDPVPTVGPTTTAGPTTTTPGPTSTTSTTTTPPSTTTTKAYTVAGVGTTTVSVTGSQISLVSAVPAAGWTLDETQQDASGVESRYVQGERETRIDFEIEDGQLRVRVRERNDATDERTERFEYFPL